MIMESLKFLVIYGRKEGVSEEISSQELYIYAPDWNCAVSKAKEYETGFEGLELRLIIKI